MIRDRETNKPKGFAFVRFETKEDAMQAIKEQNDTEYEGNTVTVEMSRPMRRYGGRGRRGGGRRFRRGRRNNQSKPVAADGDAVATNGGQENGGYAD